MWGGGGIGGEGGVLLMNGLLSHILSSEFSRAKCMFDIAERIHPAASIQNDHIYISPANVLVNSFQTMHQLSHTINNHHKLYAWMCVCVCFECNSGQELTLHKSLFFQHNINRMSWTFTHTKTTSLFNINFLVTVLMHFARDVDGLVHMNHMPLRCRSMQEFSFSMCRAHTTRN